MSGINAGLSSLAPLVSPSAAAIGGNNRIIRDNSTDKALGGYPHFNDRKPILPDTAIGTMAMKENMPINSNRGDALDNFIASPVGYMPLQNRAENKNNISKQHGLNHTSVLANSNSMTALQGRALISSDGQQ